MTSTSTYMQPKDNKASAVKGSPSQLWWTDSKGFTLVELMITSMLASLLTVTFYGTYRLQKKSHDVQTQVVEMQQNIRAGLDAVMREVRMTGYDPTEDAFVASGTAKINQATDTLFAFSADTDGNGALGTTASPAADSEYFALYHNTSNANKPRLSLATSATTPFTTGSPKGQPIADFVELVEFAYVLADGSLTNNATAAGEADNIRAVRVSLLAKSRLQDVNYRHNITYTTAGDHLWCCDPSAEPADPRCTGPSCYGDSFRRRLTIAHIDLRNM